MQTYFFLIDFLRLHIRYLPTCIPYADHLCPVCLEHAYESRERVIQVDLPTCHHIFGATCFETLIYHSYACPICRTMWFQERQRPRQAALSIRVLTEEEAQNLIEFMEHDSSDDYQDEEDSSTSEQNSTTISEDLEDLQEDLDDEGDESTPRSRYYGWDELSSDDENGRTRRRRRLD